jgi:uncharacterized protein YndB with AHSA1/START domain
MPPVDIEVAAPPESVWGVLANPQLYSEWVVGAQEVRDADETWPQVGAKLHHSTGVGPLSVDDETEVLEADEPRRLVLLAKLKALGQFRVTIQVEPSGEGARVTIEEGPVGGLAAAVPGAGLAADGRNVFSLRRLKALAER